MGKIIVNGVERLVPVAAESLFVNDYLGRPIPRPKLGSGNKGKDNKDNKDPKGTDNKDNNYNKGNNS
jgi:hypothetical protein